MTCTNLRLKIIDGRLGNALLELVDVDQLLALGLLLALDLGGDLLFHGLAGAADALVVGDLVLGPGQVVLHGEDQRRRLLLGGVLVRPVRRMLVRQEYLP